MIAAKAFGNENIKKFTDLKIVGILLQQAFSRNDFYRVRWLVIISQIQYSVGNWIRF